MTAALRRAAAVAWRLWAAAQIKRNGQYSFRRLLALREFAQSPPTWRELAVVVLTPLSSLAIIMLFEVVPLNSPEAGLDLNHSFYGREFLTYFTFCLALLQQFCWQAGPSLPISTTLLIANALGVAVLNTSASYLMALLIGFPVPFTMVLGSPSHLLLEMVLLGISWSQYLRANPALMRNIMRAVFFFLCQASMVIVYPLYFYAFSLVPDGDTVSRPAFLCVLAVIKLVNRQLFHYISRTSDGGAQYKPQIVVFNADVVSSLFVAFSVQYKPSFIMAVGLAAVKVLSTMLSLRDVRAETRKLTALRSRAQDLRRAERGASSRLTSFFWGRRASVMDEVIQIAARYNTNEVSASTVVEPSELAEVRSASAASFTRVNPRRSYVSLAWRQLFGTRVAPLQVPHVGRRHEFAADPASVVPAKRNATILPTPIENILHASENPVGTDTLQDASSELERLEQDYVTSIAKLLYMTEFVVLVKYVEVAVPVLYSLYLVIMFHMPNRVYYAQFAGMDAEHLAQSIVNVLLYTAVELLTTVIVHSCLHRLLRFSPTRQLAFVLTKQAVHVQSALLLWLAYSTQASLVHFGNDYSFQFAWLAHKTPPK